MAVKIADKIIQMNDQDYPLMDASAVEYTKKDGTTIRVNKALDALEGGSGGTGEQPTAFWVTDTTVGGLNSNTDLTGMTPLEILQKITTSYNYCSAKVAFTPLNPAIDKSELTYIDITVSDFVNGAYEPYSVSLYNNDTLIDEAYISDGSTASFTTQITSDSNYIVRLTDTNSRDSIIGSKSYICVYPTYVGLTKTIPTTSDEIKSLNKLIKDNSNYTYVFTSDNDYIVFAYPISFGDLVSIKDPNDFELKDDFIKTTVTMENGIIYNVYATHNQKTVDNFKFTFKYVK